ncbi:MAG: glycosyltransferase family 4 protein, partial [Longimicrobiales bacterium]
GTALVIANRLPYPLDDGWKRRTFHVLRGIATGRKTIFVTLHAGEPGEVDAFRDALGPGVRVVAVPAPRWVSKLAPLLGLMTSTPYQVWRLRSGQLRRTVRALAREENISMAVSVLTYVFPHLEEVPAKVPRIVDTHNIDSIVLARYAERFRDPFRRAYARMTASRLAAFERRVFREAAAVWVCSAAEMLYLEREQPAARVQTIPNGVDSEVDFAAWDGPVDPDELVFFGRLDYFPNTDAIDHFLGAIFPLIKRRRSSARLSIIGAAAPGVLEQWRGHADVVLRGRVSDVREAVGRAAVVVVPLRAGGGTRLKILEALSLEKAVVSTTVGAEGLELRSGTHALIADEPAAFADAVCRLLEDPALGRKLGRAGRTLVREHYDWRVIEGQLNAALGRLDAAAGATAEPGRRTGLKPTGS